MCSGFLPLLPLPWSPTNFRTPLPRSLAPKVENLDPGQTRGVGPLVLIGNRGALAACLRFRHTPEASFERFAQTPRTLDCLRAPNASSFFQPAKALDDRLHRCALPATRNSARPCPQPQFPRPVRKRQAQTGHVRMPGPDFRLDGRNLPAAAVDSYGCSDPFPANVVERPPIAVELGFLAS